MCQTKPISSTLKPALHLHFLSYDEQHSSFNHLSKIPGSLPRFLPPSHLWALTGHQVLSDLLLKSTLKSGHLPMVRFLVQASSFLMQNPVLHSNLFPPNPHLPGCFCWKKKKSEYDHLFLLRSLQGSPSSRSLMLQCETPSLTCLLTVSQAPCSSRPWSSGPLHFQNVFPSLPFVTGSFSLLTTVLIRIPFLVIKTQLKIVWDKSLPSG